MRWREELRLALRSAKRQMPRTALTTLAVALASALVVTLLLLASIANSSVLTEISSGGPITAIRVRAATPQSGQLEVDDFRPAEQHDIGDSALARIRTIPGVVAIHPVLAGGVLAIQEDPRARRSIVGNSIGILPEAALDLPLTIVAGRLPTATSETEVAVTTDYLDRMGNRNPEGVIGTRLNLGARQLFRYKGNILSRQRWVRLSVVGVVTQDLASGFFVVPLSVAEANRAWELGGLRRGFEVLTSKYSGLVVICDDLDRIHSVRAELNRLGYATSAPEHILENVQRYGTVVDLVLGAITLVGVVIAGIAVADALTSSVRERRQEIAVMKAIGARSSDIRRWFLIEAGFIGAIGGTIGTTMGVVVAGGVTSGVNRFLATELAGRVPFSIRMSILLLSILGAVGFAAIAGYAPARWAAGRPPKDAMEAE